MSGLCPAGRLVKAVAVMYGHVMRWIGRNFPRLFAVSEHLLSRCTAEVFNPFVSSGGVYILLPIFHAEERDRRTIP